MRHQTSMKALNIPEITKAEALKLLKDRTIMPHSLILWDGSGSLFWFEKEGVESENKADRLLVLDESTRGRIDDGIDWIWGDILMNHSAPNDNIGYVIDSNQEIELAFYDQMGPTMRETYERKMHQLKMR